MLSVTVVQEASGLDPEPNRARLRDLVPTGSDLVVLPEAFARDFGTSGSDVSAYAEPLDGPFAREVAEIAAARDTTVVAGMFETSDDPSRPFNTLVVRGAAQASYRKIHLYDSFGYRESDALSPGALSLVLVEVAGFRVGLMTCYDLRFPEHARLLVDRGAEVLAVPSAWVAGPRKVDHWRTLVRARAIENTVFVVAAAQPGPRYSGHSLVVDPLGDVLVEAGADAEVLQTTLDRRVLDEARQTNPSLANRRLPPHVSVTSAVVPRTAPRRRATRNERVRTRSEEPAPLTHVVPQAPVLGDEPVHEEVVPGPSAGAAPELTVTVADADPVHNRLLVALWVLVVGAGAAALVSALIPVGPGWLDSVGAVAIVTAYSWGLAARTGGRPVVFGCLALAVGVGVVLAGQDHLRTGAAVMTCVISAVLGVMATIPAVRFVHAARECVLGVLIAAIGAMATIGFDPVVSVVRFEYVTLGLGLFGAFAVVYRLGAGLHGLGRRGFVAVGIGATVLALTLLYAELLRRYGTQDLVENLLDGVRWSREHVGAFPRPIETVLGVPALVWGCHMRARRRQGWWLCAFGVAATAPVANALVNPAISLLECGLSVAYGLAIGLVIGYVVIRIDLAVTGSRGQGGRRLEEATAVRPEPSRTAALL